MNRQQAIKAVVDHYENLSALEQETLVVDLLKWLSDTSLSAFAIEHQIDLESFGG